MSSQRHRREIRGFDTQGRAAYEFGQASRITVANQWARSMQRGHSPAARSPAPVYSIAAAEGANSMTATVTFSGAGAPSGATARLNWGDGTSQWVTLPSTPSREYAAAGAKTITATIAGATQTAAFTAVAPG